MTQSGTQRDGAARPPQILIAGIGNIFLGDDAFGVEVVQRLARRPLPANIRVVDFGIRGIDLAYALLAGVDVVILVDAMQRGEGPPGTLYLIEPETSPHLHDRERNTPHPMMQTHGMHPAAVLALVESLGGSIDRLYLVACEPTPLDADHDLLQGLSDAVAGSIDGAIGLIEYLVDKLQRGDLVDTARDLGDRSITIKAPDKQEVSP